MNGIDILREYPSLYSLYQGIKLAEQSGKPLCFSLEAEVNGNLIPVVHKHHGHELFATEVAELLTGMKPQSLVVHLYQGLSPKDHSENRKHTHNIPLMTAKTEPEGVLPSTLDERLKDIQERTELRIENKRLLEKLQGTEAYIQEMDEELEAKDRIIQGLKREVHSLRQAMEDQESRKPSGTLGIPGVGEVNVTELAGILLGSLLSRYLPQIDQFVGVRPQPVPAQEPVHKHAQAEFMPAEEA
ncbi:MAG: hypothetical protein KF690_11055 [Bacteroidetes bacterium]|nr:hypothetical protein [Bacteroidota bacterium]